MPKPDIYFSAAPKIPQQPTESLMPGRLIAIGDIHGCLAALETVLGGIDPQPEDTLVTLGDYVDRGMHSREVIERLMALREECRLVPILGNHDEMFLAACEGHRYVMEDWLLFGGDTTFRSYDRRVPESVPDEHVEFLKSCRDVYETETHFFVHGNYMERIPLSDQQPAVLRWRSLREHPPGPHVSGKIAVVGHTAQKDGEILDLGHLVCIDTCCYGGGWLTAMDVHSRQLWQANQEGRTPQQI